MCWFNRTISTDSSSCRSFLFTLIVILKIYFIIIALTIIIAVLIILFSLCIGTLVLWLWCWLLHLLPFFWLLSYLSVTLDSCRSRHLTCIMDSWAWRSSGIIILRSLMNSFLLWNYRLWVFSLFKFIIHDMQILLLNLPQINCMIYLLLLGRNSFSLISIFIS